MPQTNKMTKLTHTVNQLYHNTEPKHWMNRRNKWTNDWKQEWKSIGQNSSSPCLSFCDSPCRVCDNVGMRWPFSGACEGRPPLSGGRYGPWPSFYACHRSAACSESAWHASTAQPCSYPLLLLPETHHSRSDVNTHTYTHCLTHMLRSACPRTCRYTGTHTHTQCTVSHVHSHSKHSLSHIYTHSHTHFDTHMHTLPPHTLTHAFKQCWNTHWLSFTHT